MEYTKRPAVADSVGGLDEESLPVTVTVYVPAGTLATIKLLEVIDPPEIKQVAGEPTAGPDTLQ